MYEYGGWTFFIPYLVSLFLIGLPIWMMETAFGQLISMRLHARWGSIHPRFWGISIVQLIMSFFYCTYYITLIVWSFSYFFDSFKANLPWLIDGSLEASTKEELWNEKYFLDDTLNIS